MAKPTGMPTVQQIQQLPVDLTMSIPPEWEDHNGHVNVQHYLSIYHLGGWQVLDNIGINQVYLNERKVGIFDLEHHIRYLAEIQIGEEVSVYSRVLNRNEKLLHGMLFIVNNTQQRLACTIDYLSICIDKKLRSSTAIPADMALKLDDLLAQHQSLQWSVPVFGNFNI